MKTMELVPLGSTSVKTLLAVVDGAHTVKAVADRIGRSKTVAYTHLNQLRHMRLVAWPVYKKHGAIHATVGPVSLKALRLRESDPEAPCESLSATTRKPPSTA